jgi:hypothetical protein
MLEPDPKVSLGFAFACTIELGPDVKGGGKSPCLGFGFLVPPQRAEAGSRPAILCTDEPVKRFRDMSILPHRASSQHTDGLKINDWARCHGFRHFGPEQCPALARRGPVQDCTPSYDCPAQHHHHRKRSKYIATSLRSS